MVVDVVCGMEINENAARCSAVFQGNAYFFCSEGCRAEFERRPQEYSKAAKFGGDAPAAETEEKNRNV